MPRPQTTPNPRRRSQRGMTLIEIMVVVVIIGLIGTLAGVRLIRYFEESKIEIARTQVCNLQKALQLYRLKKGTYPSNSEGLNALVTSGNWAGRKIPKDPWNGDYFYRNPSLTNPDSPDVMSLGFDGKEGGTDYNTKDIRCEKD
ncbi:MAG: type II secretion system major pseudopilin GspG [Myxococcales bacterium]|nr:type II secretion system major pseudopilin GspG [Myxococcales bacterium]